MRLWLLLGLCLGVLGEEIQIDPGCPPGMTGTGCLNPICSMSYLNPPHDGLANHGDTVALFHSQTCREMYSFAIDNFMQDLYISVVVSTKENFPTPKLYDPAGNLFPNDGQQYLSATEMTVYYRLETAPRGLYTFQVTNQQDGECRIKVTAPSTLTVDGGFVEDVRDDNVAVFDPSPNQGIGRYPRMNTSTYLAFKVQNENFPIQAQGLRILQDGYPDQIFDIVARYNCSNPHITQQSFNCSMYDTYHAEFTGIDGSGNSWQRVYDFICDASPVTFMPPTGTPFTPPPVDSCLNGGTLTQNGTCFCGEYFEGVECEWKLCMNGGTLNVRTEECLCANGWSGEFCEHVQCKTRSDDRFYRVTKALGFVIRSAQSMAGQMGEIMRAASNITDTYTNFQVYLLSVVQNGELLFTRTFDNPADFINGIRGITHPPVDTVCSDSLLLGVNSILDSEDFQKYPDSPIYVFSDGVLNDGVATMGYALQQMSLYRPQLYFILSDSASGFCDVDISAEGYQTLLGFSAFSQGLAIKTDLDKLAHAVNTITETIFGTSILAQNDLLDCRQAPQYQPFFVDESIRAVWIAATGNNLTLTLTLPDLTTRTPIVYFSTGNFQLWLLSNPMTGAYMVNLKSRDSGANECSYRVTAETIFSAYFGASSDLLTDIVGKQPVLGKDSHLVARIHNIYKPDPIDISTEITLWTNDINSGRVVLYSSSGVWRDECAYDLYFGTYQCTIPGMGFYVSIYITDNRGYTVLRTLTGYCAASLPPSPGEQCQNGGATYNGTCICPIQFSGDRCEVIHCENQGTPKFGTCVCPPGFAGQFCEIVACLQTNQFIPLIDPDFRSLTFLMHDSITTRSVFRTINDVSSRVVHDIIHQHPRWFTNYQLVRFNDTDYQSLTDSRNPEDFIQGITTAYNYNQQHSDYSCSNLDLYRTLLNTLRDQNVAYGGVFYIFVYGMPRPDSDSYDQVITHIEGSQIQINVVQFSMNPCGQDYTQDGLMALTQASGGSYILSSGPNAGNIMKSLPTDHQAGLIYERFVDNCADTTFYVPVDANTQSITAYIQGELSVDPVYTKPDGTVANRFSVSNVWSDIGSDSRMDQIIQSCDPGWQLSDGHCFFFDGFPATWQASQTKCQGYGGSLATIYSQTEQNWLNYAGAGAGFWIGLNDIVDLNQWVWALPNNQVISLNSTRYTNWGKGQPSQDVSKRCVMDDAQNGTGWMAADCSEMHYYACSKDTYNTEFEPGDNGKNLVQRGIWSIRVRADGPCSILLRAQSSIQVAALYTTNVHSDFGAFEPLQGTTNNRLIAHVGGLKSTTTHSLEYGHVYSDDGKLLQAQTISHRDASCSYDYISTPFKCVNSAFQMMLTGVDNYGYAYQRVIPVLCLGQPDASSCENGGTFYEGICICPPNFLGLHCETILCQNGGYAGGALGVCKCPPNFSGTFCEMPVCTRGGIVPDISTDSRTFILALDGSNSGTMGPVLDNLSTTLTTLLKGIDVGNKGWFTSFVAVVFRDSQSGAVPVFSNTIYDTDYTSWITKITAELKQNPYSSKQTSRAIFGGLAQALSHASVKENSFAFVLTNSKAEDIRNEDMVLSATARTHTSIYFMFIGDDAAPGGGDYNEPAVADLFEAAHNSGGSAYQIATSATLGNVWLMITNSLRNSYTIITHHLSNCKSYTDYIQLGSNGTEVYVDVAQGQPAVTVTNADGNNVQPTTIFQSKTNILSEFPQIGLNPGIWGISVKGATDTCMFNVRGHSDLQILAAFTQDVETDGGWHDGSATAFPKANGISNAVVATMAGGGALTHAQLLDVEEHSLLWASPLIQRKLCSYNYISTQIFVCDRPSFILAVDGLDAIGHPFRRLLTFHCQGYIPPSTPSKPTTPLAVATSTMTPYPPCDLSVAKVDFIFVMDSSSGVTNEEYSKINGQISLILDQLDFTNSRLVLATYDQTANLWNSTFDSIKSKDDYRIHWIDVVLTGYTGQKGNNIDDFLTQIGNEVLAETPFRDGVRKVISFVSSIGWDKGNAYDGADHGYNDPTVSMKALKTMGAEFIPISFGAAANPDQLSAFSSKCLQHAGSPDDFGKITSFIQWNLCQTIPQC